MRIANLTAVLLLGLFGAAPFSAQAADSQLILKAKMVSIEAFKPEEILDAVDTASASGTMPTATVVFKIDSVVKGTLPPLKIPASSSLWNQTKGAYEDKNLLKIITMDYQNPDVDHEEKPRWFAVGVQSPLDTFNVISWSELPESPYRLVFSKSKETSGWVLQNSSAV